MCVEKPMSTAAISNQEPANDRESSEFLLRVCHDLRTCLRSIQPPAESLLMRGESGPAATMERRLSFIMGGARKLDLLVEGLAAYAVAMQINRGTFQIVPLDIVLRGVLMKLDKELRDNRTMMSCDKMPPVSGDPDRLGQVFDILIRNALVHRGQAQPRISVVVQAHPEGWLFSVRDNGPGLEAAYLERIFQPFERLNGNGSDSIGPGLGLATCRIIVERHGGRVWAESEANAGFTVSFTLPRLEE
jgi:signal transduction histidine kinase